MTNAIWMDFSYSKNWRNRKWPSWITTNPARYIKGSIIYKEGSRLTGFYCVTRGILKIFKTGIDGKEQIIRFAKKGDIIAYRSLLSQELACTTAKVIEESVLSHIPYQTLLYLIQNNWQFSHHMLQIVCKELVWGQRLYYRHCSKNGTRTPGWSIITAERRLWTG